VFNYLKELIGYDLQPVYHEQDVNLVTRRQCSIEKAELVLGFKSRISVPEGLERYVEWREQLARNKPVEVAARVR